MLSGEYATAMVSGMQERDTRGYPKMAALLKHFTACVWLPRLHPSTNFPS